MQPVQRLVVGISGGSGAILGIRLLQALQNSSIETHLIVTSAARLTIEQETSFTLAEVQSLAHQHYAPRDLAASIASGSFATLGMVIVPCSIKTLSAVANSYAQDLIARAADVTLKEGRALVLVVRETPLHRGHIRLMDLAARAGAVIFPPVPAFYQRPDTLDEMIDHTVGRILARVGIDNALYTPWQGLTKPPAPAEEDVWSVSTMTIATHGADAAPHAAAVYFAADDARENLYFFSAADSLHSIHLSENPQAAAEIHVQAANWREIRGLQLRGRVTSVPEGAEWQAAWQLYAAKFPFAADMQPILAKNQLYVFRPTWIRQIDNRKGFGHKEETTRP